MTAFEKIASGIPQMDEALDGIRLGDNVVWQVEDLKEFSLFVEPFVKQAVKDKRKLFYIRFASHEPLVKAQEGVEIISVELSHRFENFAVEIHNIIAQKGKDAFYVFDCLSELQTAWAADLMMGNFFRVTCPFLFQLDTVAFFPLLRGRHSCKAIARIRDTTQLFLDVYSDEKHVFVRPLKVWNRYSETMFLAHLYQPEKEEFRPLTGGVEVSHFYQLMNRQQRLEEEENTDNWDRFFLDAMRKYRRGEDVTEECSRMCNIMMTRDERMRVMIKQYFSPEDYFQIKSRMVGTGMIGGKACGMLLARKLVEAKRPDLYDKMEPHDSFYIGSDVFYSYIVENGFWDMRIRQRTEEEYFSLAKPFADCLRHGRFSGTLQEQFRRLLDYYGSDPFIVRSSSILEDGFGNAFAGKYESVFCANTGTMEERLAAFEDAIRTVYASTMSLSALDYRLRRGMEKRDEQMALLVQRVSGSHYDDFFMPCAAGVGYSYSPYRFQENIDPSKGMLRLVMGLGTGAVDRTLGSYPRLVSLDRPEATAMTSSAEKHQYSQRKVDVIHLKKKQVEHWDSDAFLNRIPTFLQKLLYEHDTDAEQMYRERGQRRDIRFVSCKGLVENQNFMEMMRDILALIQEVYQYPVDIEYTINISEEGEYILNLLQCRPLQIAKDKDMITMPQEVKKEEIFLECRHASMGLSCAMQLDVVVYVDPIAYYHLPYQEKFHVAQVLREINWAFRGKGKHLLLLVPGRICTSSAELGVPTTFADISEFSAICEIAEHRAGYQPELSYGSHIFQDLVEADILYTAVFENEKTQIFAPEKLDVLENCVLDYSSNAKDFTEVVRVYPVEDWKLYHDMKEEHLLVYGPLFTF
ncbi:MAG: PEP/pyruvate-binding domain-containing protein [Lachnospiraceae bacterium]